MNNKLFLQNWIPKRNGVKFCTGKDKTIDRLFAIRKLQVLYFKAIDKVIHRYWQIIGSFLFKNITV